MTIIIKQSFDHKAFGHIGKVELEFEVSGVTLEGDSLPVKSFEYLVAYGIRQAFTDCYSQAKSGDKAREMFDKKVAAVIEGKINLRERLDIFSRTMRELTDKAFAESAKMTVAAFYKAVDDEEKADSVYNQFAESVRESLEPVARERIEREANIGKESAVSVADILASFDSPKPEVIKKGKAAK